MDTAFQVRRFSANPVIYVGNHPLAGDNVNGPSLIRVPDWVEKPLGRYYLYFAHHEGSHIRMAYTDDLEGQWKMLEGGVLHVDDTICQDHIASPDVLVDDDAREIRLYFHGYEPTATIDKTHIAQGQSSYLAISKDGVHFEAQSTKLAPYYLKVFRYDGAYYGLAKYHYRDAVLLRSDDGIQTFEPGPHILPRFRHGAVRVIGDTLQVFYSRAGDDPERILVSQMDLKSHWSAWEPSEPQTVISPETDYEGADVADGVSSYGIVYGKTCQLRDPDIFEEDDKLYLAYAVGGEYGIALAQLETV